MKKELVIDRDVVYTEKPPFPYTMLIELTNACNHACVFCGYSHMERKKVICNYEFVCRILGEAYENGTREVGFYLVGEPFLNDRLSEYISVAKNIGYTYIFLDTNGACATPERLVKVIDAGLDSIKFSVNAATRETYLRVHKKDDFETVKKNIEWLHWYCNCHPEINIKKFISFIKCNYNVKDIETMHCLFGDLVDHIYFFDCWNQGGSLEDTIEADVVDNFIPVGRPCSMVFNRLHITAEGYLDACCADINGKLVVANLNEMNLLEAWHSEEIVKLRRQHLTGFNEDSLCKKCMNV